MHSMTCGTPAERAASVSREPKYAESVVQRPRVADPGAPGSATLGMRRLRGATLKGFVPSIRAWMIVSRKTISNDPTTGARLRVMGINIDHKKRKQDGGLATLENTQPTHPYCNSGYKKSEHAKAIGNAAEIT